METVISVLHFPLISLQFITTPNRPITLHPHPHRLPSKTIGDLLRMYGVLGLYIYDTPTPSQMRHKLGWESIKKLRDRCIYGDHFMMISKIENAIYVLEDSSFAALLQEVHDMLSADIFASLRITRSRWFESTSTRRKGRVGHGEGHR